MALIVVVRVPVDIANLAPQRSDEPLPDVERLRTVDLHAIKPRQRAVAEPAEIDEIGGRIAREFVRDPPC